MENVDTGTQPKFNRTHLYNVRKLEAWSIIPSYCTLPFFRRSSFLCHLADFSVCNPTTVQWPRTTESVATVTVLQEPAPRRTAASAETATALQEHARRRMEASAATVIALQELVRRNSRS